MSADPYLSPGSSVLRNKLGITDPDEWAQVEANVTSLRVAVLLQRRLEGRYDLSHLQAFHRFIFEDLYDWAGELRTVDIAKTTPFCQVRFLNSFAHDVFSHLARQLLVDLDRDDYLDRLTINFANVNALHPFREGNGRAQRAFFAQSQRRADTSSIGKTSIRNATMRCPPRRSTATRSRCASCSRRSSSG